MLKTVIKITQPPSPCRPVRYEAMSQRHSIYVIYKNFFKLHEVITVLQNALSICTKAVWGQINIAKIFSNSL